MKKKDYEEYYKLMKEKPYLLLLIGLGLILIGPLLKLMGIVLVFAAIAYYVYEYYKKEKKKK